MPNRRHFPSWRSLLAVLIASSLVFATAVSTGGASQAGSAPVAADGGSGAAAQSPAQDAAKKKRRRARRRVAMCAVTYTRLGRKRKIYVRRYAYRFIRRGGRRFRIIVRRRIALKAPCARSCAVVRAGRVRYRRTKKRILVPRRRGNRLVLVRRRVRVRVPRLRRCPKGGTQTILGTPITITLQDSSLGTLDFGAFVREAPLTGSVRGYAEGRVDLSALKDDVNFTLTRGRIDIGQTAVFIDDECQGDVTAAIRTGKGVNAAVDQSKSSSATLFAATGRIRSIVRVMLKTPLELRNGEEVCTPPEYISTGYTQLPLRLDLAGKLTFAGNLGVDLRSGEQVLDAFEACIAPGDPTLPCSGFAIPFPFTLSTHVVATLVLGQYGRLTVPAGR
jgi:hypothetical protein